MLTNLSVKKNYATTRPKTAKKANEKERNKNDDAFSKDSRFVSTRTLSKQRNSLGNGTKNVASTQQLGPSLAALSPSIGGLHTLSLDDASHAFSTYLKNLGFVFKKDETASDALDSIHLF